MLAGAAVGVIAGMFAGSIAGAGARVAMRMVADGVADGVGIRTDFTLLGSLAIVVSGMLIGTPMGVLFNAIADRMPGPRRLHGLPKTSVRVCSYSLGNITAGSRARCRLAVSLAKSHTPPNQAA